MSDRPGIASERLRIFQYTAQSGYNLTLPPDSSSRLDFNSLAAAPSRPHFAMSPLNAQGVPSTGFLFAVLAGAPYSGYSGQTSAVVGGGGLTITPWRYMPTADRYASLASITGVQFDQLIICTDLNPCELYFQVSGFSSDGYIVYSFTEQ